jgi:hypothetical protein
MLALGFPNLTQMFKYADKKSLDADLIRIEAAIERLESPCFFMPPPASISMTATAGGQ